MICRFNVEDVLKFFEELLLKSACFSGIYVCSMRYQSVWLPSTQVRKFVDTQRMVVVSWVGQV